MGRKTNKQQKLLVIELLDVPYLEEMPVFFILVEIFELFWSWGVVVAVIRVDLKFIALQTMKYQYYITVLKWETLIGNH